jgi:hypothetical protein
MLKQDNRKTRIVLEPATWQRYAGSVQQRQQHVEKAMLGHTHHPLPPVKTPTTAADWLVAQGAQLRTDADLLQQNDRTASNDVEGPVNGPSEARGRGRRGGSFAPVF